MKFQTVNLQQGSAEWLAFRREKCTASEAPMMLGLHANVKRSELLRMKKLGTEQEFSDYVQRNVLDKGHEVEEMARAILEAKTGEDFYPVTGYAAKLSASLDGMTLLGDTIFEHKQLNAKLIEAIDQGTLPDQYMAQVQQQLMLTDAEKCIFVCSDGTEENWYATEILPDSEWFTRITQGWMQFQKDLEAYEPEEIKEAPTAASIDSLPGLALIVSASVEKSNLPAFTSAAQQFLANINTDLKTDQDFADAEETVKFLKQAEDQIESAKQAALSQTADLDEALRTMDDISGQMRAMRLKIDKLVKTEKENRKTQLLSQAILDWTNEVKALNDTLALNVTIMVDKPDFAGAIKGKRNLLSMQDAVDSLLANAKIDAKIECDRLAANLAEYHTHASGYEYLFNDLNQIIHHPVDALIGIIQARINEHKVQEQARLDAERERIRAEEQRKLELQKQHEAQQAAQAAKAPDSVEQPETPVETKAQVKPATQQAIKDNPRLDEIDQFYLNAKQQGLIPVSDLDADAWIWPLILEAYNIGRKSAHKVA